MDIWIKILFLGFLTCLSCADQCQTDLPQILLFYQEGEVNFDKKTYIEAQIKWDDQSHIDMARAKYRGGWSRQYPKKNYTINLQADPNLTKLSEDNDWILNASYIDKTMMRHAFSYQLMRAMTGDSLSAPSTEFVEVKVNHEYQGLYLLHPRIDRSFLDLKKSGSLFKDPPIFRRDFELETLEKEDPYHQKYPDLDEGNRNIRLDSIKQQFLQSGLCDNEEIFNYFDKNSILNWHLLLLTTHGSDGLLKNFYLYQKSKKAPFKICIWDYDHSFGRDGDNELNQDTTVLDLSRNWLLSSLSKCDNYKAELTRLYLNHRQGILQTDRMIATLDEMYKKNRQAIYRNGEKWPWDSQYYHDKNDADQEVELMKKYIIYKMRQLDDYFLIQ